jgi:hypothetical protein
VTYDDKRISDPEDGIAGHVWVTLEVQSGNKSFVAGCLQAVAGLGVRSPGVINHSAHLNPNVKVTWSVDMPPKVSEHRSNGAVIWDAVWDRPGVSMRY